MSRVRPPAGRGRARPPAGSAAPGTRGFTLLEVLVALVVVALGMSALLETLTQSADNVAALRERTVAEWIAMNQIALARLALNAPGTGTTTGDVQNCANGNWHWQQQVNAVDAVPGLLSITVSVQRTGNATPNPDQNHPVQPPGATPGATGSLGANVTLGPTAALGSVSSLSTSGCASFVAPGSSLGSGSGPGLGSMPSLGAGATSLGSSSSANGLNSSVGASLASSVAGAGAGTGAGAGSSGNNAGTGTGDSSSTDSSGTGNASSSGSGSSSGTQQGNWLVTVTGFRGNALGAASGESPTWAGAAFPGSSSGTSNPTTPGVTNSTTP
jgi:type II secretion system protein I